MTLKLDMNGRRVARHTKNIRNEDVNQVVADYLAGKITIEQADEMVMPWIYRRAAISAKKTGMFLADTLSASWEGWRKALKRYDPQGGASFTTFASLRMSGQCLDYARTSGYIGRGHMENAKKIEAAQDDLESRGIFHPTDSQIAEVSGMTLDIVRRTRKTIQEIIALSVGVGGNHDTIVHRREIRNSLEFSYKKTIDGRYRSDWHHVHDIESNEIINLIMSECAEVHEKALEALKLRAEGHSHKQIGKALGFSESRSCQIEKRMKARMMAVLPDHGIDMSPERFVQRMMGRHRTSPVRQYSKRA